MKWVRIFQVGIFRGEGFSRGEFDGWEFSGWEFSWGECSQNQKRDYENLNEKFIVDNKLFWKTVKPLLSGKVAGKDEIHLIEYSTES